MTFLIKYITDCKKKKFVLLLFWLSYFVVQASSPLVISENMYYVDHSRRLIVINQNTEQINAQEAGPKTEIALDEPYYFIHPVSAVEVGLAYEVINSDEKTYQVYFTRLPLISISTPNEIVDEPRVFAEFTLSESNGSVIHSNIGIEYRGAWSQSLPKKSLRIELWEDRAGQVTKNISLCGMRSDDDWNLQAMFNEPLRLRSKTSNELWKTFHKLYYHKQEPTAVNGIEMQYVELFINGEYRGIYALSERVDRKQLQLKNFDYAIRGELYKAVDWGNPTLRSISDYDNSEDFWDGFEYHHPEEEIDWINLYGFIDFVLNDPDHFFYSFYPSIFEINNAVDYYLFLNLLRANDNTGKNIFIARYDYEEPYFYIPWDLDGVFGTMWRGDKDNFAWDILSNGLYDRLIHDCKKNGFYDRMTTRWNTLRKNEFSHPYLMNLMNKNFQYLYENGAYERESKAWNSYQVDETHLDYISNWLSARLTFLDEEFNKPCTPHDNSGHEEDLVVVFPNPAHNYLNIEIKAGIMPFELKLYNNFGQPVYSKMLRNKSQTMHLPNLIPGMYFVTIQNRNFLNTKKIIVH